MVGHLKTKVWSAALLGSSSTSAAGATSMLCCCSSARQGASESVALTMLRFATYRKQRGVGAVPGCVSDAGFTPVYQLCLQDVHCVSIGLAN